MVESPHKNDTKNFWKNVRTAHNKLDGLNSCIIDNINTPQDQVNKFSSIFKCIFDDPECNKPLSNDESNIYSIEFDNKKQIFNVQDINIAINKLNVGIGPDDVHTYHLKNSPEEFRLCLCKFYNLCTDFEYIPRRMEEGIIIPLVKNKFEDLQSSVNYRPIINSSIMLKLLEYLLIEKLESYLCTSNNQHGFKKGFSTETAFFSLKETITDYNNKDTPVYIAFLNFSKAFDKVNHHKLFYKLYKKGVPMFYINLIKNWYRNQYVKVKFNGCFSREWQILNGVRQGGILSPYLFNIYIDDMIEEILKLSVGCKLGIKKCNIIAYADDICLLAPSISALQFILNKFYNCINYLNLKVNIKNLFV